MLHYAVYCAVQGISNSGDADASEVEDEAASASSDEEVEAETEASEFEDEVAATKSRSSKPLTSTCSLMTVFLPPFIVQIPCFQFHTFHCC